MEGRGGSYKGVGRKGWVHGGGIEEAGQPCCHATMAMRPKKRQKEAVFQQCLMYV